MFTWAVLLMGDNYDCIEAKTFSLLTEFSIRNRIDYLPACLIIRRDFWYESHTSADTQLDV